MCIYTYAERERERETGGGTSDESHIKTPTTKKLVFELGSDRTSSIPGLAGEAAPAHSLRRDPAEVVLGMADAPAQSPTPREVGKGSHKRGPFVGFSTRRTHNVQILNTVKMHVGHLVSLKCVS